jgi:hypothetical protein
MGQNEGNSGEEVGQFVGDGLDVVLGSCRGDVLSEGVDHESEKVFSVLNRVVWRVVIQAREDLKNSRI